MIPVMALCWTTVVWQCPCAAANTSFGVRSMRGTYVLQFVGILVVGLE
jgi:hypothetical protein